MRRPPKPRPRIADITPSFMVLSYRPCFGSTLTRLRPSVSLRSSGYPWPGATSNFTSTVGIRVIDLSADHRFSDPAVYEAIYSMHTLKSLETHCLWFCPKSIDKKSWCPARGLSQAVINQRHSPVVFTGSACQPCVKTIKLLRTASRRERCGLRDPATDAFPWKRRMVNFPHIRFRQTLRRRCPLPEPSQSPIRDLPSCRPYGYFVHSNTIDATTGYVRRGCSL